MNQDNLSSKVIGAAIEVHKILGPGLLESAYELALEKELQLAGVSVLRQIPIRLEYKGMELGESLRLDMLVEGILVVEIKATEQLLPLHEAQLLTYLRSTKHKLGLLINFNVPILKNGIKRVVNDL